ncbi:MAG: DUF4390 domain-containing protein [Candidatus Marinimicrobia bacterium]|jgi:hypothetical protein|nr:DUF4390 domain-containing protein [Candidatus Neomarinimicrobiota bacterium]
METGIFAAFSKKVISTIIAVGSMFYSTIDGVTPNINALELQYKNDYVLVSTMIENCYTEELDQIFYSGNLISLYFAVELYQEGEKKPDSTYTFYHSLRYSPIGNDFTIYYSEQDKITSSLNINQVKLLFPLVTNYRVTSANNINDNTNYYFKITAWLDKIRLEGMEEELNLLYYWNSIKPNSKSDPFTKSDFQI